MPAKLPLVLSLGVLFLLGSCSQSERQRADRKAEDARAKAEELAHHARRQAEEVASQIKTNTAGEAREKLRRGEQDLKKAGEEAGSKIDRAALIAKVHSKLAADLGVETVTGISVDADGGKITLSGTVASEEQKKAAERAALAVSGVSAVQNDLRVNPAN